MQSNKADIYPEIGEEGNRQTCKVSLDLRLALTLNKVGFSSSKSVHLLDVCYLDLTHICKMATYNAIRLFFSVSFQIRVIIILDSH